MNVPPKKEVTRDSSRCNTGSEASLCHLHPAPGLRRHRSTPPPTLLVPTLCRAQGGAPWAGLGGGPWAGGGDTPLRRGRRHPIRAGHDFTTSAPEVPTHRARIHIFLFLHFLFGIYHLQVESKTKQQLVGKSTQVGESGPCTDGGPWPSDRGRSVEMSASVGKWHSGLRNWAPQLDPVSHNQTHQE